MNLTNTDVFTFKFKIVIDRITVVKFRMDSQGGNGAGCFEVKLWTDRIPTDTVKFMNAVVARFGKCRFGLRR